MLSTTSQDKESNDIISKSIYSMIFTTFNQLCLPLGVIHCRSFEKRKNLDKGFFAIKRILFSLIIKHPQFEKNRILDSKNVSNALKFIQKENN